MRYLRRPKRSTAQMPGICARERSVDLIETCGHACDDQRDLPATKRTDVDKARGERGQVAARSDRAMGVSAQRVLNARVLHDQQLLARTTHLEGGRACAGQSRREASTDRSRRPAAISARLTQSVTHGVDSLVCSQRQSQRWRRTVSCWNILRLSASIGLSATRWMLIPTKVLLQMSG